RRKSAGPRAPRCKRRSRSFSLDPMTPQIIETCANFPEKLGFLFEPAPYKVGYGGRGATKSWGFARALLIAGTQRKLRILCARETQKSIRDSVHQLLVT